MALLRRFDLLVSVPLMIEYEAVVTRPEQIAAAGVTTEDAHRLLDAVAAAATPVGLDFVWRPQLIDPADEMVLETAINGGADLLVTFNVKHLGAAATRFTIRTERPRDALRILGADENAE